MPISLTPVLRKSSSQTAVVASSVVASLRSPGKKHGSRSELLAPVKEKSKKLKLADLLSKKKDNKHLPKGMEAAIPSNCPPEKLMTSLVPERSPKGMLRPMLMSLAPDRVPGLTRPDSHFPVFSVASPCGQ